MKKPYAVIVGMAVVSASFAILINRSKKNSSKQTKDQPGQNPMEGKRVVFITDEKDEENADGVCGHLKAIGETDYKPGFYERGVKRALDIVLSLMGMIFLSPVFIISSIAIEIDDPGPIVFAQNRVGQDKRFFKLHKFRSMKMSTPHDVPTHMLENPEQYITKTGAVMRRYSIDELVQLWDILVGNISVIGPRPALWNQDLLTAERDKYGANDVKPGLTGWAQINGRDELEIPEKAKLDGEYAKKLKKGGLEAFAFDCRCFFGTVLSVFKSKGVVEGGTGTIARK